MNSALTATVVICTRDRPGGLVETATSVVGGLREGTHVVVVDQSTDRRTHDAILDFSERGQITRIPSRTRGLTRARNEGLRHATGDLIFFTDDDCIVPKNWVESISARFAADPHLGALVAPVVAEHPCNDWGWTPTFEPSEPLLIRSASEFPLAGMMGANMVFRATALEAINGFDEVLGPGGPLHAADDIDAVYRIVLAGFHVAVVTEPAVVHFGLRRCKNGDAVRHQRAAYRALGAYYAKHIRCGDVAAAARFVRQVAPSSSRPRGRTTSEAGLRRVFSRLMLAAGAAESLQFDVDRESRQFVVQPVASARPVLVPHLSARRPI